MSKDLVVKVGEYEKDGETKGEFVKIGVILSGDNGEYALLDPTISLSGVYLKQAKLNHQNGKQTKGVSIMCGVYDRDNQSTNSQPSQPQQSAPAGNSDDDPYGDGIPFMRLSEHG